MKSIAVPSITPNMRIYYIIIHYELENKTPNNRSNKTVQGQGGAYFCYRELQSGMGRNKNNDYGSS